MNIDWQISIGSIVTIITLLISFWTAHHANVKRLEEGSNRIQKMETKLEIIFDWFRHNVVGRGESVRKQFPRDNDNENE